ncbi:hypothetical protein CIG75_09865 [Tumebacillus algifaecis]|uniref:Thymidylate kinase n=1 Tax=Tumebacillus algifaecis TaxID=1214604 RepID=A0A223D0X3_9BACL|nr:hypothetical protein [Tumebacillus algifaecis]ASS75260.1 hypothetical protein CIG75_09865 [Tumebacillus algifaecis]
MLIAFSGCDGAGKSTQVKAVQQILQERGLQVKVLDKWEIRDHEKFRECRMINIELEDLKNAVGEMEGHSRAMFLFWAIGITMTRDDLDDPNVVYLLDGYWMKHAAVEIEYGCSPEWIELTAQQFRPADLTFYFDVLPEVALERKDDFNVYECGRDPECRPESFIEHQTKLRKRMLQWSERFGWEVVNSMQEQQAITELVMKQVDQLLEQNKGQS